MIIRTNKQEIENYFNDEDHINQSLLKKLSGGVDYFNKEREKQAHYDEVTSFVIGSAVDTMLTQGEEIFNEQFYVSMLDVKPSPTVMSIIKQIADTLIETRSEEDIALMPGNLSLFPELICSACRNHNWNPKYGDEALIRNILEQGNNYFDETIKSIGKQIISLEEKVIIDNIVKSLKTHDETKDFFENVEENFYVIYQKPVYAMINNVKCKALPDIIVIDAVGNLTIFDIKTMEEPVIKFPEQAKRFRYDIQAAFYLAVINRHLENNNWKLTINIGEDSEPMSISVGAIKGFGFIVESKSFTGNPVIYHANQSFLNMGKYGREYLMFKNQDNELTGTLSFSPVQGFLYLLDLYQWHLNNGFDIDRIIKENNNNLNLEWGINMI
jgi:hypothetical protein